MIFKHCLVLTDDKAGNINPALGFAEALERRARNSRPENASGSLRVTHKILSIGAIKKLFPKELLLCLPLSPAALLKFYYGENFFPENAEFPDLVVGHGNASVLAVALFKKEAKRRGLQSVCTQLLDPRISAEHFDYVIAPSHDKLSGENVISVTGSVTRINRQRLRAAKENAPADLAALRKPLIAVLIGGVSKRSAFSEKIALRLAYDLKNFAVRNKVSLAVTASRRTGASGFNALRRILCGDNIYFWDGEGENPYYSILALSEAVIVTGDSVNMISEAATAGKQVLVYHLPGKPGKLAFFYKAMRKRGHIRDFALDYRKLKSPPFNEAERAVSQLLKLHDKRKKRVG